MRVAGFDFRPSILPSIFFGALMALFVSLGFWQLDRAEQKRVLQSARDTRGGAESTLELNLGALLQPTDRFKAASVEGRYRGEQQWLLDNRVLNGRAGYHVYSLLETYEPHHRAMLVNRGWVEVGPSRSFLPHLPVPDGTVKLTGRLDLPESVGLKLENDQLASIAPLIVLQHMDLEQIEARLGRALLPFALILDEDQPGILQRDWSQSLGMTPEKHVGYAVQWFALAAALLIIYFGANTRRVDVTRSQDHAER